jgi:sugar O-acyltransferase (sialic acid O-acetyltransferase NeuD family)
MSRAQPAGDATRFRMLYIFGCGGSGREVAWLAEQAWGNAVEVVFLVDHPRYLLDTVNGHDVRLVSQVEAADDARFVVALGDCALRRKAVAACTEAGLLPTTVIHPGAELSRWTAVSEGAVIYPGSVLTTNVSIGAHVQINAHCSVSHDVSIGDFSTLSPGAHIAGHVRIGNDVFVGIGASIINGSAAEPLTIGDGAVIAAGACITTSVAAGAVMAGVPAVRKR